MEKKDFIVVLNFGSQFAHLINRRLNELNVENILIPWNSPIEKIISFKPKGIIFSGGPSSVYDQNAPYIQKEIFALNIPILGICYGMQAIEAALQSSKNVFPGEKREYSDKEIVLDNTCSLFENIDSLNNCLMNHTDQVHKLPEGFKTVASTNTCKIAAMANEEKQIYAVQFHPEASTTFFGSKLFENFLFKICKINQNIELSESLEIIKNEIKENLKNKKVITLVSGLKSALVAYLVNKNIGNKNNLCLFIDNGVFDLKTKNKIFQIFKSFNLDVIVLDKKDFFFKNLNLIKNGKEKREIIAKLMNQSVLDFISNKKLDKNQYKILIGSSYEEFISSGKNKIAQKIINFPLVSDEFTIGLNCYYPLANFYRDEIITMLKNSKFPSYIYNFKYFPSTGLILRIMGAISNEKMKIYEHVSNIIYETFYHNVNCININEIFPILLEKKIIGEMGDGQVYKYIIVLRAIEIKDSTTFKYARISWDLIDQFTNRIINEVNEVSHVVYDVTSAPPSIDEWQ